MACKSCDELKLENAKLKETQVKFVKFDKSANSLREMLNNQKSPSCKIGLGFNSDKASTNVVASSAEKVMDGSTIKGHGFTLPGSVCLRTYLEPDEWIKDSGCSKQMTVPAATLTAAPVRVAAAFSRRRKGVVIRDHESESTTSTIIPAATKSKDKGKGILVEEPKPLKKKQQIELDEQYARELHAELNKDIDWDEAIDHVKRKAKEDHAVKRYQVLNRKPQTEAQARKNMIMYLKNVAGFKMDYFKGMSYDDIRPIFEAKFNTNVAFLLKTKEQIEEDENKALQKLNKTPAERATKRRKLDEEVEELRRHLQIMPNEDDDVYTEATPLARKVPVVDYLIIKINNKPYYKIIRADDTYQLDISFLSLLRNFDREELEALWRLVKERFSTTKPKNFFEDFLLVTLGAMFEKPDIHAQI
nr:hypothetical protein [Tanacetum cinerariifolium]